MQNLVHHESFSITSHVGFHVGVHSFKIPWSRRPSSCCVQGGGNVSTNERFWISMEIGSLGIGSLPNFKT